MMQVQNYQSKELNIFTEDGKGRFRVNDITGTVPGFAPTVKVFGVGFSGSNADGGTLYVPQMYTQVDGDPGHVGYSLGFLLAGKSAIEAALSVEASTRATADTLTDAAIAAEIKARNMSEAYFQSAMSSEQLMRTTGDFNLGSRVDQEAGARVADVNTLTVALASTQQSVGAETARAQTAEAGLVVQDQTEKSAREAADVKLSSDLAAELASRTSGDAKLAGDLLVETSRSLAAEEKLSGAAALTSSRATPTPRRLIA